MGLCTWAGRLSFPEHQIHHEGCSLAQGALLESVDLRLSPWILNYRGILSDPLHSFKWPLWNPCVEQCCSSDDGFSKTSVCFTLFCCKKSTCFCNHSKYYQRLESEKWVTLPHWGRLYLCFWQLSWGEFHQVVDFSADLYHSGFRFCIPTWGVGIISLFVYQLGDQDHFLPLFF